MNRRIYLYIVTAFILPAVFQELLIRFGAIDEGRKWFLYLILTVLVLGGALLAEYIAFRIYLRRTPSVQTMLEQMDELGSKYRIFGDKTMFHVPDAEFDMMFAQNVKNYESILANRRPHTVYHSLSAKKHLSWVEFVFWDFLRDLKESLGFKVLIAFHEDENGREAGEDTAAERYREMCRAFGDIAKRIIGRDTMIINEDHYLKKHPRLYCDFHKVYVEKLLEGAKRVSTGESDYAAFMRSLSFTESVFPLIAAAKKHDRIYAIDRKAALDIWEGTPLNHIKRAENIYFVLAQTLTDPEGKPLKIFTADGTLNITDDEQTIKEKLAAMPKSTMQVMYNLISTNTPYTPSESGEDDPKTVLDCIMHIKNKFGI